MNPLSFVIRHSSFVILAFLVGCTPGYIRGGKPAYKSYSPSRSLASAPLQPSQSRPPQRILGNSQQGWMTGLGGTFANTYRLAKWGQDGVASFVELQPLTLGNPPGFNPDCGFQGRVGNRFIMGGVTSGGSSVKIGEWDPDTGQLLYETQVGDGESNCGEAAVTANGGFAGVVTADSSPANRIWLDAFYRPPPMPPNPSGTEPPPGWWWKRFDFPSNTGSPLPYQSTAVWWKGFLWFFFTRDSAGQVGLARLRVEGNGLAMDYFDAGFINNGDPAACSGEYPILTAIVDKHHDRIVLGYHSNQMYPDSLYPLPNLCDGGPWAVHWALTEVKLDLSFRLLGLAEWWVNRNTQTRPILFAQPDGIYFALAFTDIESGCGQGWNMGRFDGNTFATSQTLPYGTMLALSADEWFLFYNRPANKTELLRMEFAPRMSIERFGPGVKIAWPSPRPTDVVEESANGGASWQSIQGTYTSPVVLPAYVGSRWFRVRRQ